MSTSIKNVRRVVQVWPNEAFVITVKKKPLTTVNIVPYHIVFVRLRAVSRFCFLVAIMTPVARLSDNTASNMWLRRIKVIIRTILALSLEI